MNLTILALGLAVMGVSVGEGILVAISLKLQLANLRCLANFKH